MGNINLYTIEVVLKHFSLALIVFEIFTCQNLWPWKCRSNSWRTTFTVSSFDGIYESFYLMAILALAFTCQNSHLTSLYIYIYFQKLCDLENIGVAMCNIRNGAIRWLVSTSIKVLLEQFSLSLTVFQILYIYIISEIVWPWKCKSTSRYTTFAVVPFDG